MTHQEIARLLQAQRRYFASGATLPVAARRHALTRLKAALTRHEAALCKALHSDLGKSPTESYMCELGLCHDEINWMLRHLHRLTAPTPAPTPLAQFAARSFCSPMPYGNVLILSPWNYPVLLTLEPLIDALAAGNTALVKPSAYSPATAAALQALLTDCFAPQLVAVVTGGRAENQTLLEQRFDKIFFTGGKTVGRAVLHAAAEDLTPVTLELGGKSPCLVDATAKLDLAARRIVFGKFLNCGQTCVAPDYIFCDAKIRDALVAAIKREITRQFGKQPLQNPRYGKIINQKHFARLRALLDPTKTAVGGQWDAAALRIAPTVLIDIGWDDAVMDEEIFGPLLPVLTFTSLKEAVTAINARPHPLALYFFSEDKAAQAMVLRRCQFGGGCLNDVVIHLASSALPFGGVGESGMGAYHGRAGFAEFSHQRSIVDKKTWLDLPVRYQPYSAFKDRLLRVFMR